MSRHRKVVSMLVTVTVPRWMTAAQARREVRTLINDQSNWMCFAPDHEEVDSETVRARSVIPSRNQAAAETRRHLGAK